ncbi:MAG: MoaD/ThiS family protein [Desulfobacterales bacterium]
MKISVETLSLPSLSRLIGRKTEIEMDVGTVKHLIDHLIRTYGKKAGQVLLDQKGELDIVIQIMINDEGFLPRKKIATRSLKEGDKVKFLLLVGGG